MLTAQQLKAAMPKLRQSQVDAWIGPLSRWMEHYEINTPARKAAFLAQIGHESCDLLYVKELGGAKYFEKYDTGRLAAMLGNTPAADGDGAKYCGRGLIQITGRANYARAGEKLALDLINRPELLEQPENAAKSACWFWFSKGLNAVADAGDFDKITKIINGGTNGKADRDRRHGTARRALGLK